MALESDKAASKLETCDNPKNDSNRDRNFEVTNFGRLEASRPFILRFFMSRSIHVFQFLAGDRTAGSSQYGCNWDTYDTT